MKQGVHLLQLFEEEECTLTLASDGSTHHGTGETCRKVATHLWPRAERETSRRCGGEPLRPGRIGESGRVWAGQGLNPECSDRTECTQDQRRRLQPPVGEESNSSLKLRDPRLAQSRGVYTASSLRRLAHHGAGKPCPQDTNHLWPHAKAGNQQEARWGGVASRTHRRSR